MEPRLSFEQRKAILKWYWRTENVVEVQRQWRREYRIEPPTRLTIARIRDKFETHGTICDVYKGRSGRPLTSTSPASSTMVLERRRGPIEFPPRSPDLFPLNFYLWGTLKNVVYRRKPATLAALREEIETEFAAIAKDTFANVARTVVQRTQKKHLTKPPAWLSRVRRLPAGLKLRSGAAEQIAILQALQILEENPKNSITERMAAVYTDSQITIALLKNNENRNELVERIKQKFKQLKDNRWTIHMKWVKAHVGLHGNEMADRLAKEAAMEDALDSVYDKIPEIQIIREIKENRLRSWQRQWESITKGTGCKLFFPSVNERLKNKLPINPQITAIVSGHEKTRVYYHRFGIIDSPLCKCEEEHQTTNHLLFKSRGVRSIHFRPPVPGVKLMLSLESSIICIILTLKVGDTLYKALKVKYMKNQQSRSDDTDKHEGYSGPSSATEVKMRWSRAEAQLVKMDLYINYMRPENREERPGQEQYGLEQQHTVKTGDIWKEERFKP
ncbi:hypothetical protein ANN_04381 [Periplaneta americana]|uniref:RNase H type-1 domain-containing protein n=1 Tax=Periplaneta americana TaxID=6978 RepID=A0ABQ8TA27_PERAM|nr:hypothetical protein ANN_04381 [Periplaneta americana]